MVEGSGTAFITIFSDTPAMSDGPTNLTVFSWMILNEVPPCWARNSAVSRISGRLSARSDSLTGVPFSEVYASFS